MFNYNKIVESFKNICKEAGLDISQVEKKINDVGLGEINTPFLLTPSTVSILFNQLISDPSIANVHSSKFNDNFLKELTDSYTDKYVAWIDILGFKNAVQAEKGIEYLSKYTDLFSVINQHKKEHEDIWAQLAGEGITYHLKMFSVNDGIILISDELAKEALFDEINNILCKGYYDGIYMRGAITKGKVFLYDNLVYGEGLIEAYEMEKNAKTPRIVISPAIQSECHYSKVDGDGLYCFDYFSNTVGFARGIFGKDPAEFIKEKKESFDKIISDPLIELNIREKYSYLKNKLATIQKRRGDVSPNP